MAVVYCLPRKLTPKAFSAESAEESSFLFFPPFFLKKRDNACHGSDFAFAVTMRLQMKAPQMQFAVMLASQRVTDEPFTGTAYFMLFSRGTAPNTSATPRIQIGLTERVIRRFFF